MNQPVYSLIAVSTFISALSLMGCGGGDSPQQQPVSSAQENSAGASSLASEGDVTSHSTTSPGTTDQPRRQDEIWTDADGHKYLGNVPFDAFFDQPYSVASNMAPLNGGAVATDESPAAAVGSGMGGAGSVDAPETGDSDPAPAIATSGGDSWSELIPIDVLDKEVTTIRNFLNGTLQSVGSYNSSMLMIPPKAAAVAVLSEIAMEHPTDVSWKEDASYIRDLAKRMNESTLQRGKKDQARLLELFENMTDTFNRSRPAGLEEPPAEDGFADVAEMRLVMMRMEEAEKRMKTEAGSQSSFDSKKDMIRHEATILQTLTKVVTMEGYGYSDDAEFVGYAKEVMDAAQAIRNSADANDFDTYDIALSKITTACQRCHSVYKNN